MRRLSQVLAAFAVLAFCAVTAPAVQAQVNPTERSVTEESMFQALGGNENAVSGRVTIPDASAGNLIKPENPGWADLQRGTLVWVSIVAILGTAALLALFFMVRGRIRVDAGLSGRKLVRFGTIERFAHWTLASTFIVLALTGLNLIIGKTIILPLIGEAAFGSLTALGKIAHNYLAWPFMVSLVMILLLWAIDNIPNKLDVDWLKAGGGLLKKGVHPPARKFNAGQKVIFWSVILGGAGLSFTGFMMLFPALAGGPADWQLMQILHALIASGLSAIIVAHIYIGSVGMEGAFDAMGSGEVDENWAKEHHALWVDEVKSKGRKPSAVSTPAE